MSECGIRMPLLGSSVPRKKTGTDSQISLTLFRNERIGVVKELGQEKWLPSGDPGQVCHFSA